ncbi:Serine protease inhibitor A3N [Thelohanellus kitauei]|uniref:Serine protease inhibitor A3N n=1 Tax=Thelohanellus kitauei TaxID=669202 RepID=A0A0C2N993_THEKT|nr:Serine protease inhibitor A3N [Thelohanellus kitauei]
MSIEGVNSFTSTLLNQLYVSQNATGNIVFNGLGLYLLLGAINFGLSGRSSAQLSLFIGENFEELHDSEIWMHSKIAKKLDNLGKILMRQLSNSYFALFCSCDLNTLYEKVSRMLFNLDKIQVDFSNPTTSAREINAWMFQKYTSRRKSFHESMIRDNMMIFIHIIFFHADLTTKFDPSRTNHQIFFDEKGEPVVVRMMNQECIDGVYTSPDNEYRILFQRLTQPFLFSAIVLPSAGHSIGDVIKNFKVF